MQLESITLIIGHNQLVTIAFNFIVAFLLDSKAILVAMIFPSNKHHFIAGIIYNAVYADVRANISIMLDKSDNIR